MSCHALSVLPTLKAVGGVDNEIITAANAITDGYSCRDYMQLLVSLFEYMRMPPIKKRSKKKVSEGSVQRLRKTLK